MLIPEDLDMQIRKAAQRLRLSKGEWVRRALETALTRGALKLPNGGDPLALLDSLDGPTCDIRDMLAEIESGRS